MVNEINSTNSEEIKKQWWQPALLMFAHLSAWIVVPVILGTLIGKWLDKKYSTEPWLFIATVGVSFIISMVAIARYAAMEYKKIEKESSDNAKIQNPKSKSNPKD
jgi:F0F1-type ATP synthase assembly protein I